MRAEIVYNKHEVPRLQLTFESDEERALFKEEPNLSFLLSSWAINDDDSETLDYVSFRFVEQEEDDC
jgi:hypothetical protein